MLCSFFAERKMKDLERVAKESAEELKKRLSYVSIHPDYLKIAKEAELRGENASQTGEKSAPDKAILFSYVLLNGNLDPEFLDAYAWRLANGFNSKYRYSAATSQTIFAPFENVRICATKGGACYVAYPTEKTRGFFESQKGKIVSDYYPLFIKALYQSYALHANAEKVQKHVSFERDSDIDPGLFEDINRFLVKTTASSVSFIQHQSDFYNYLKKQLRIDEDTASLVEYFTRLKEEIDRKREEYEDKEQRESDGTRDWALALISFMAVFSALTDCYDWVGKVLDSEGAVKYGCWDWRVWVALICHGLIVLAFIAAICIIIISWRKRKKKGKKKGS